MANGRRGDITAGGGRLRETEAIDDPSVGLYSPTDASKGATLTQKVADGIAEIVTAANPLSAFDQLVADWRTAGGDQMRAEYQQLYAASRA